MNNLMSLMVLKFVVMLMGVYSLNDLHRAAGENKKTARNTGSPISKPVN